MSLALSSFLVFLLRLTIIARASTSSVVYSFDNRSTCPPWSTWNVIRNHCVCVEKYSKDVKCEADITEVRKCTCLTYNKEREEYSLGECIYTCGKGNSSKDDGNVYWKVDSNPVTLNQQMCGHLGRGGTLCGQCMDEYRPLAYSYYLSCIPCTDTSRSWRKFLLVAFLPLTLFYLVVILFKVSITPAYMYSFVFYAQIMSAPVFMRNVLLTLGYNDEQLYIIAFKILSSLYGIWSLDFCRALYKDICFNMDTLETLALEYTIALYPLFLIAISYVVLKLYSSNVSLLVYICRPFRCLISTTSRNFDTTRSLLDAYVVFFVLSLTKIIYVSMDLLVPTKVRVLNANGTLKSHWALFFDGSKAYFGSDHLPFAILAIVITSIFIITPTMILFLFPFPCFQRILNRLNWNVAPLHHLVDKFQGFFQNGRDPKTRDYRCFSACPNFLFFILYSLYALTRSILYFPLAAIVLVISVCIFAIVQPYKRAYSHFNKINIVFYSLIAVQYILIAASDTSAIKETNLKNWILILCFALSLAPLVYISLLLSHKFCRHFKLMGLLYQKFKALRHTNEEEQDSLLRQSVRPLNNYM